MNCWASIPALGNIDAYHRAIQKFPMLTVEEEIEAGMDLEGEGAMKLILSHLRLGVSEARKYANAKTPLEDLIQEANIGLVEAAMKFDATKGRFTSLAMHYIRSRLGEFAIRNSRQLNVATTKSQRKLFFNLRTMKNKLVPAGNRGLSTDEMKQIAELLNVREDEVAEMEKRLYSNDVELSDSSNSEGGEFDRGTSIWLADMNSEPLNVLSRAERDYLETHAVSDALGILDDRSRSIIEWRYMSETPMTLHDVAAVFGISAERVRQVEVKALKKIRVHLAEFA